ncbi:MAG: HlyU family transcriptional regulator [Thiomonas sp.]|jgi:hypothetical protein|uniref:DUF6566 family protein n=1 Tax=Thiomonas sp. TaxID=2047785 RepID=UPI002A35C487|nr:DUF6566 family protein [Thiomonas sp.]MDY0331779.1 HlyU family transcriptional regulator [Thiomonas sp.]
MTIINHEGYEISPATQQLADTGEWTLRVSIVKHRDSQGVTNQQFFDGSNSFATKEEAEQHCIEFGKRIINGEQPGLNVNEL